MAYTSVPLSSPGIMKSRCVLRSANMSSISANNWSGSPTLGWRKIKLKHLCSRNFFKSRSANNS